MEKCKKCNDTGMERIETRDGNGKLIAVSTQYCECQSRPRNHEYLVNRNPVIDAKC